MTENQDKEKELALDPQTSVNTDAEHDVKMESPQDANPEVAVTPEAVSPEAAAAPAQPEPSEIPAAEPVAMQEEPAVAAAETPASHEEEEHEEEHDSSDDTSYDSFSKEDLLKLSREMLASEDVTTADKHIRKIRHVMERYIQEEAEAARQAYMAGGGEEDGFEFKRSAIFDEFYHNFTQIRSKYKSLLNDLRKERENNLKAKREIIEELKGLIDHTEQKGSLDKVKALQTRWKEIGPVPQADANDLYQTYNVLLDMFYDHKSIEYDLKELDRRKNLEAKLDICARAEELMKMENLNEAVRQLNAIHDEFKSIGPVPKEESDKIWNRFKAASDHIYEKKRSYAEEFKKSLQQNMLAKQALCLEIETYLNFESDRIKEWNEKTKEILSIQKRWEAVGPLPKEVSKDINRQFWFNFKKFFANKAKFFEHLEAARAENLAQKEALCAEAEELKESSNWNEATDKFIELQAKWKDIGPVPDAMRDKIYVRFKAACDHFFERKRNKGKQVDHDQVENLKKKQAIVAQLEQMAGGKFDQEAFQQAMSQYYTIGFVPKKHMDTIVEKVVHAAETAIDQAELEEKVRERLKVTFHAEFVKHHPGASRNLRRQEQNLRAKISQLQSNIANWENNLDFFANSQTAEKLKQDFRLKVEKASAELKELKDQLKMLSNIDL